MASTYTTRNGIELISTGEQSGTWGDTTNVNLQIIDRALSGSTTIALTGTAHTLTTTDGTLSEGMYRVLVLGGSPSGTNTITIAPNDAQKMYLVQNNGLVRLRSLRRAQVRVSRSQTARARSSTLMVLARALR